MTDKYLSSNFLQTIDEFILTTGTDEALAKKYLSETNYDLNEALEKYKLEDHIVIDGLTYRCADIKIHHFGVISWNLEGIERKDFSKRISSAISTIVNSRANFVLLQELVTENIAEIRKNLSDDYHIFIDNDEDSTLSYCCGILVGKHPSITFPKNAFKIEPFENSRMGRKLLILTAHINEIPVKIITTHLESTAKFSTERKIQMEIALKEMKKDTEFSIFAGDLNLRDKEIVEIGGIPNNIVDVWEATGKRPELKYTWDPKRNLNANQNCPYASGQRFDRMYFYSNRINSAENIRPIYFGFDGLKKVPNGIRFPSDHWAIVGHFHLYN